MIIGRVFDLVVVTVAIGLALAFSFVPLERLHDYILLLGAFEKMIPILAVGALLKYIFKGWYTDYKFDPKQQ